MRPLIYGSDVIARGEILSHVISSYERLELISTRAREDGCRVLRLAIVVSIVIIDLGIMKYDKSKF